MLHNEIGYNLNMSFLVAIEPDPKCYSEIQENWAEIAKELGHKILLFKTLSEMHTELSKPENQNHAPLLIMISADEIAGDLASGLLNLKTKYKCDVLLSMFDDVLNPLKKTKSLPVSNIIYKPFDLTILKEHTRFALLTGQLAKTQFVHTTQSEAEIESLKKIKIIQLSEFGVKIEKTCSLVLNKSYKFYHPLFVNKKQQSAWAKVIHESTDHYELFFSTQNNTVLTQIRKKINSTSDKVKSPDWKGPVSNNQTQLKISLNITDETVLQSIQESLQRNFTEITFILPNEMNTKEKLTADLIITDVTLDTAQITAQYTHLPVIIRFHDESLKRSELEEKLITEHLRFEKPIDKAYLIKVIKTNFPLTITKEEINLLTIKCDDIIVLSEIIKIQSFSEAAINFTSNQLYQTGQILEIALPEEDENNLNEIKAKIHFANDKVNVEKEFEQQFVLYGMKDEYLKIIRLWALQKHIEKNKQS